MLRHLKAEFLVKGERPETMLDPAILNREVMAHFNMPHSQFLEMMYRFRSLSIVDFNEAAMRDPQWNNAILYVKPYIVEVIKQIDDFDATRQRFEVEVVQQRNEQAKQKKDEPTLFERLKRWAYDRWWFVAIVIFLAAFTAVALFTNNLDTLLRHFGINVGVKP